MNDKFDTNCWAAERFCFGGTCDRVKRCKYPEKKTCEAVRTEINRLMAQAGKHVDDALKLLNCAKRLVN